MYPSTMTPFAMDASNEPLVHSVPMQGDQLFELLTQLVKDNNAAAVLQSLSSAPACASGETVPPPASHRVKTLMPTETGSHVSQPEESHESSQVSLRTGSMPTISSSQDLKTIYKSMMAPRTPSKTMYSTKKSGSMMDKTARNREAAARSRMRQKLLVAELQARVNRLESSNTVLAQQVQVKETQLRQALVLLEAVSTTLIP